jgi:2-hydroxy-3-oxopropionate reductase
MADGTVGWIGLGIMGRPMVRNLMRAGHELVVHNRSREPQDELAEEGATGAASPRAVAEAADVVITMLPTIEAVRTVWCAQDGVLAGARPGALVIDMSTSSPQLARELAARAAQRGAGALDAPVSGGDQGAIEGTLSIMVGGADEDVARARPLLDAMGSTTHVGPAGTGQVVKACNQIIVALVIEAVSEGLVLASKAGVKPHLALDAMRGGLAGNRVMESKRRNFLEHDFAPGARITIHHKDLGIALATARELDVALPVTALVDQMLAELRARGSGELDHSALLTLIEDAAQHRIGDPVGDLPQPA